MPLVARSCIGFASRFPEYGPNGGDPFCRLPFSPHFRFQVAGYEDGNDAARLSADPTFRRMSSEKVWKRGVALTSTLQPRWVKTGDRLVKHVRYCWILLAEGHLTRRVFGAILRRIWTLALTAG